MTQRYAVPCKRGRGWRAMGLLAMASSLMAAQPVLAAGLGDMLGALAGRSGGYTERGAALEDGVARLAVQLNSTTPKDISDHVRLDSVSASKAELIYHYTLLGRQSSEVPPEMFNTRLAPAVKKALCEDQQSLRLLKSGARIGYQYRGRDGSEIGKLSFGRSDCSEAG